MFANLTTGLLTLLLAGSQGLQVLDVQRTNDDGVYQIERYSAGTDDDVQLNADVVFRTGKVKFYKSSLPAFPSNLFEVFPNATEVDMEISGMKIVRQRNFINGTKLKVLLLQGNQIEMLPSGVFMYLENLEHLDLGSNDLKSLYPDTFVGLRNLKELRLYYNKITSIQPELLRPLNELKRLDLTINEIGVVPDELFLSNPKLEDINLGYCGITSVGRNAFRHLKHLKSLTISHNNFPTLYLPSLEQLIAFYSHIKECHIDGSVKKILMDHNDLEKFTIRDVSEATEISLAANKLRNFSFLRPAKKLQFLDISWTHVDPDTLNPELFAEMTGLYELNLSKSNLTHLDSHIFSNLASLRKLYLQGNQFTYLDYQIFVPLKKLNTLDLRENKLTLFDLDALRATGFSSEVFGWMDAPRGPL